MKLGKKVVGLIATGFLLAACGGTKEAAEKVDSGNLAAEQKISISSPASISTLDTTQTTDKNTFTMAQHLFEGLYRFDDDSATVPALAKDVKISDDGRKYHFTLREGIKWSNGEPITAQDFVYSWKKLVTPATIGPNAYLLDSVKNSFEIRNGEKSVDELGISAPNDKEFIVELKQAQPSFLAVVSIAWLAPQNQKFVEAQGKDYALDSEHLLYSGPFTLANWDATSDTWTLKKNPEYYDADQVKLAEVAVSTIKEDNTGINLYQANELDLVRINGQYVQQYQEDPGYVSHPDVANYFLDFNKKEGTPLANVHLRKAIGQAIDKEALTQSVLNDGSKPLNGLIPSKLYANQSRREKNYELSLSGWIAGSSELDSYFNLYAGESSYNYGNYHNAKYDQLVEDARTINANNPEKQFAEYKEAEDILLNQDAAQVPLYQSASNYLINPKLKGISYHLYGDYFHLRNAYLTE
ncbi:peptide ABC transporter substrate-binding protein [Enterococcus faecalis]|nr:peptide ABC transporter substrate-binding protein [Enterococcus faecalis]